MSEASDRIGERGVRMLPARELLDVIGDLFVELMPVEPDEATAEDQARAALLRQALAEVAGRVARLCPALSPTACSCGESYPTADDLDEHFWVVFVPGDDTGLDGKVHAEVPRHRR
jgi:hypothetical protein